MSQTMPVDLTSATATEIAELIRSRRISATEAVKASIDRIQALDTQVRAVVVPLYEQALSEAREADSRDAAARPLHGVPVTVKECFHVAGTPSTVGLDSKRGVTAGKDAELVARLRKAGAIVVAKTNVPQFLLYSESDNPVYGRTANPWNLDRAPGGSSGGEGAAVAAGYAPLGLGTDIGGSVRIPAHFCGVHSLKPTPGGLSLDGTEDAVLFGQNPIPDAAGPLARSVADLRLAMSALGSPLKAVNVRGLRIGVYDDNGYFPVSPAIRRAIREAASALQSAGCKVEEVTAPDTTEAMRLFYAMFTQDGGAHVKSVLAGSTADPRIKDLLMLASLPNALRPLLAWLYSLRGQRRVARVLPWAGRRSPAERAALAAARESLISRSQETHREVEALVCPPAPFPALPHGASKDVDLATFCYTAPFNVLAWPAGIVAATRVRREEESERPRSKDRVDATARQIDAGSEGLPAGVQVAARAGRDEVVLGVMEVLEAHFRTQSDYPATPVTPSGRG